MKLLVIFGKKITLNEVLFTTSADSDLKAWNFEKGKSRALCRKSNLHEDREGGLTFTTIDFFSFRFFLCETREDIERGENTGKNSERKYLFKEKNVTFNF